MTDLDSWLPAEQLTLFELDGDDAYPYCDDPDCSCNDWPGYCNAYGEIGWEGPKCHPNADTWFDREICFEPCGLMHYRCTECGKVDGYCPFEDEESNAVTEYLYRIAEREPGGEWTQSHAEYYPRRPRIYIKPGTAKSAIQQIGRWNGKEYKIQRVPQVWEDVDG